MRFQIHIKMSLSFLLLQNISKIRQIHQIQMNYDKIVLVTLNTCNDGMIEFNECFEI